MNIVCISNIIIKIVIGTGFPGDTVTNNPPPNAGDARDMDLIPGSGRYPEQEMATAPIFLPGKFHGQRSLSRLPSMGS